MRGDLPVPTVTAVHISQRRISPVPVSAMAARKTRSARSRSIRTPGAADLVRHHDAPEVDLGELGLGDIDLGKLDVADRLDERQDDEVGPTS